MKYLVRRVQEQVVDADELPFVGDDSDIEPVVAIELATEFADGWDTVDLTCEEVAD